MNLYTTGILAVSVFKILPLLIVIS